jgi:acetyl esterase/lipase
VLSLIGLALAVNALRPIPATWLSVPSFFAGWITSEMAPHWLVLHLVGVVVFVVLGAATPLALVACALTGAILVKLIRQSIRAQDAIEAALDEGGFARAADEVSDDPPVKWWHLGLPFRRSRPDVTRVRDIAYGPHGRRNRLDVFHRKDMPAGAPVLVQVHGGAWVIGSKEDQGRPIALHMAAHGWVVVVPNYRLSPGATFPSHLEDLKQALAWTREHIGEYGGDPAFIAVTGGSAGGHLAALLALEDDTDLQAAVPYYGVYDPTNELGTRYGRQRMRHLLERVVFKARYADDADRFRKASPVLRAGERTGIPPFLVIHGRHDTLVPVGEGRFFVERLREASDNPVLYAELPGTQHAFDVFGSVRAAHVLRGVEHFLTSVHQAHVRD